jgi:hypothetical protein
MSKYFKVLYILGLFFAGGSPALASTTLNGPITSDTRLIKAESPYIVSAAIGSLYVNAGATLTIDPGVEVTGDIVVYGNLIVNGATSSPVILNSEIQTLESSTAAIGSATINGALFAHGASLQISSVTVNSSLEEWYAVYWGKGDFIHASTTITGTSMRKGFTVGLAGMDQDQTWTNDNGIPYIIETPDGLRSGTKLTIQPGVVVKVSPVVPSAGPVRNGGLINIQGSASSPVYVTSIKDDSVGGDTNGDGSATVPQRGDWGGFDNGNGSMALSNAKFSYADWAFDASNSSVSTGGINASYITISSSTVGIYNSGVTVLRDSVSRSVFSNVEITGNGIGIQCSGNPTANFTVRDSVIAGNDKGTGSTCSGSNDLTDLRNNWWGDASGPYNAAFNPSGKGDSVEGDISLYHPWIGASPACSTNCNSSVMFLPGFEASYLYASGTYGENQIWVPDSLFGQDVSSLDMANPAAENNVYAKDGNILETPYSFYDAYSSFKSDMDSMVRSGTIAAWKPIAYDWRLDYDALLSTGNKEGDRIYYRGINAATSTPYIIQELQRLAADSRTKKVTIVAHSNGGLLAKALVNTLGTTTASKLIDKIIMVATPQLGTPKTIGALLSGYQAGLPGITSLFLDSADARHLGQSMPAAYNLLPSNEYFNNVLNPAITFDPDTLPWWTIRYGSSISSVSQLHDFMTDSARPVPQYYDLKTPGVASSVLFENAQASHAGLDNWTLPQGVQLITIAGWGNPTLRTINYKKQPQLVFGLVANATTTGFSMAVDGDGTVVDASAQWANGNPVTRYWINLLNLKIASSSDIKHDNILTAEPLRDLLAIIIGNASTSTLPQYISTSRPVYTGASPRVYFTLHSPLTLGFIDGGGNYTGSTATTTVFGASGVDYERFGEVQWLSVPAGMAGQVVMRGTGSGSFALDIESVNGNDLLATTTFAAVPVSTTTVATLALAAGSSPTESGILAVDSDGDGESDFDMQAQQGSVVLPPPQGGVCKPGMPPRARPHMPKLPDFLAIFRNGKNNGALHNKDHFPPGREKCKQDKIKTPPKKAK